MKYRDEVLSGNLIPRLPFEDMSEAANWFDHAPMSEPDRVKISRGNAQTLLRL